MDIICTTELMRYIEKFNRLFIMSIDDEFDPIPTKEWLKLFIYAVV